MNFDVKRCHDRILIPDFPLMLPQINQKLELRASAPSPASIYIPPQHEAVRQLGKLKMFQPGISQSLEELHRFITAEEE